MGGCGASRLIWARPTTRRTVRVPAQVEHGKTRTRFGLKERGAAREQHHIEADRRERRAERGGPPPQQAAGPQPRELARGHEGCAYSRTAGRVRSLSTSRIAFANSPSRPAVRATNVMESGVSTSGTVGCFRRGRRFAAWAVPRNRPPRQSGLAAGRYRSAFEAKPAQPDGGPIHRGRITGTATVLQSRRPPSCCKRELPTRRAMNGTTAHREPRLRCRYSTAARISSAFHAVQSSLAGSPDTPAFRPEATSLTARRCEPNSWHNARKRSVTATDGSSSTAVLS